MSRVPVAAANLTRTMSERLVTRGFVGRRGIPERGQRVPPGQYLTTDFPVLSAGPTPRTPLDRWTFTIEGLVREPVTWSWEAFRALPARDWIVDISCVTKWTKLDMRWRGVSVDTLLEGVELGDRAAFVIAWSDGDYTTNLPLSDVLNGQAFVAWEYDGRRLSPERRSYERGSFAHGTGDGEGRRLAHRVRRALGEEVAPEQEQGQEAAHPAGPTCPLT